ncbi:hypothetical protein IMZ48_12665 [Candidatus Bathyarchaeota archaeon]|nr:hypothetical protein [Candidatus Bathyarchaeota archaeon]
MSHDWFDELENTGGHEKKEYIPASSPKIGGDEEEDADMDALIEELESHDGGGGDGESIEETQEDALGNLRQVPDVIIHRSRDGKVRWKISKELDNILLGVVMDQSSTMKQGGKTVYTNSAYPNRASGPTVPRDGHLRLRELHAHELDGTDGGLMTRELQNLGLESTAFVAFCEDDDPGELSNVVILDEFRLGPVLHRTPQASIYSATRVPPMLFSEEAEQLQARAYVLDGINAKLRQYRARGMARLLGRTVASSRLWGQYVVIYRVDDSQEVEVRDTAVVASLPLPPVKTRPKTESQREKARIKQRDRRRRARENERVGRDFGVEEFESEQGDRNEVSNEVIEWAAGQQKNAEQGDRNGVIEWAVQQNNARITFANDLKGLHGRDIEGVKKYAGGFLVAEGSERGGGEDLGSEDGTKSDTGDGEGLDHGNEKPNSASQAGQRPERGRAGIRRVRGWARNTAIHAILWAIWWVAIVALIFTKPLTASFVLMVAICIRVLAVERA